MKALLRAFRAFFVITGLLGAAMVTTIPSTSLAVVAISLIGVLVTILASRLQ